MLGGEQPPALRLGHHLAEEGARYVVGEQALTVLREAGGVERLVCDVEVEEPFEEQVVAQPLAELTLTADRVERDQQARLEQVLGRDRGAPAAAVHRADEWRELRQRRIDDRLDAADRVVVGDERVRRHRQQDIGLTLRVASHGAALRLRPHRQSHPSGPEPFSSPC